ncbi:hypothetical protein VULLAG_LOCUS10767 [Vulpes lagopus]
MVLVEMLAMVLLKMHRESASTMASL